MEIKEQLMPINIKYIDGDIFIPIYSLNGRYYINMNGNKLYSNIYNKVLTTQEKQGYYYNNVQKSKKKQGKLFYHRVLAEMMLIKKDDRDCVNHINSNRKDNSLKNIEWVYPYENSHHAQGIKDYKSKSSNKRLFTRDEVVDIYTSELTRLELKKKYPKLTNMTFRDIKEGLTYKDITKDLTLGKSKRVKRIEYLNSLPDSCIYNIWKEYITSSKSLKGLQKKYNIVPSTLTRRFNNMNLPLKDNREKIIMSL